MIQPQQTILRRPQKNHHLSTKRSNDAGCSPTAVLLRKSLSLSVLLFFLVIGTGYQLIGLWSANNLSSSSSSSTHPSPGTIFLVNDGNSVDVQQQKHIPQQHMPQPATYFQANPKTRTKKKHGPSSNTRQNSTVTIISRVPSRSYRENAIVFLVQKNHTTYHRDSYQLLIQSLDLLYQNYLSQNDGTNADDVDIYLFHTGDFDTQDLDHLEPRILGTATTTTTLSSRNAGMLKLVNLVETPYWQLPHNVRMDSPETDWLNYDLFPVGYRHMCRFFAIQLWTLFGQINTQYHSQPTAREDGSGSNNNNNNDDAIVAYRYIWRLDEDSLIHSPIRYNLFEEMKSHKYVYGYRLCSYELTWNKFVPQWFDKWHAKVKPRRTIDWELCGFYNNFFVADLMFFQSNKVQAFLSEIDRRGFIYRKRYGDLVSINAAAAAAAGGGGHDVSSWTTGVGAWGKCI
jgi:Glycolipid 2-alpha-mannosyltransferase